MAARSGKRVKLLLGLPCACLVFSFAVLVLASSSPFFLGDWIIAWSVFVLFLFGGCGCKNMQEFKEMQPIAGVELNHSLPLQSPFNLGLKCRILGGSSPSTVINPCNSPFLAVTPDSRSGQNFVPTSHASFTVFSIPSLALKNLNLTRSKNPLPATSPPKSTNSIGRIGKTPFLDTMVAKMRIFSFFFFFVPTGRPCCRWRRVKLLVREAGRCRGRGGLSRRTRVRIYLT